MKYRKIILTTIVLIQLVISLGILFFAYKKVLKDNKIIIKIINYIKNIDSHEDDISKEKIYDFIVDSSETDKEVVEKYLVNGMSLDNIKKVLDQEENPIDKTSDYIIQTYNFDKKLHYTDLEDIYVNLNNHDIVSLEIIGKSVDERNIYGITIGKGNKEIFIDANVHAAEVANTVILARFMQDIVNKYNSNDKNIIGILEEVKFVIIPCMNPDGYEVFNFGVESLRNKSLWLYEHKDTYKMSSIKNNANGVDLNRSFPTQNAGLYYIGKKLKSSVALTKPIKEKPFYSGENLGSEPETQAAMYFMIKHYKNTIAYINMHSQGRVIYAGKPNLSNEFNELSSEYAKSVAKINGYKLHGLSSEEVGEGNDGTATDFMAELAHDFKFSSETLRLTSSKYIGEYYPMVYRFPVITLETIDDYTSDVKVFKKEYSKYKLYNVLIDLLNKNNVIYK